MRSPAGCTAPTGWAGTPCPTCWSSARGPVSGAASSMRCAGATTVRATAVGHARSRRGHRHSSPPSGGRAGEPLHDPAGPPGDHERPGRDHPAGRRDRAGPEAGSRTSRNVRLERPDRRGAPPVQPGLAPRHSTCRNMLRVVANARSRWPRLERARRAAAATPGTTFPARTRRWGKINVIERSQRSVERPVGRRWAPLQRLITSQPAGPVMPDDLLASRSSLEDHDECDPQTIIRHRQPTGRTDELRCALWRG